MDLPVLLTIPCWHRNELACTDSVLAYGYRGWPMANRVAYSQHASLWPARPPASSSLYGLADVGTGHISGQIMGQSENIMPPLQAMLLIACSEGIKVRTNLLAKCMYVRAKASYV